MDYASVDHPLLDGLFRYWNEKRGARAMPRRSDIDPLEIGGAALPHVMLCDLLDRGLAVRFRLVGTGVVAALGFDPTGRHLEAGPLGGYFSGLGTLHRLAYNERAPVFSECTLRWGVNRRLDLLQLVLPLSHGARDPAMVLGALVLRSETRPPSLRFLDAHAAYVERRRAVLSAPPAVPPLDGRHVA